MIHEIEYGGYTAATSDYISKDGDLDISMNVIYEDGGLRPILPPRTIYNNKDAGDLIYIHQTPDGANYIWMKTVDDTSSNISYSTLNEETGEMSGLALILTTEHINAVQKVTSMGNVLMIFSQKGIERLIYDTNNGDYYPLGVVIPELPISFGLRGTYMESDLRHIPNDNFTESDRDWCLANMNTFIAENAVNAGKFVFPFFIRYALRLYDGSLVNHSAPILMIQSTGPNPAVLKHVSYSGRPGSSSIVSQSVFIAGVVHDIDYLIKKNTLREFSNWKNLIKSVDIFISAPIYTYKSDSSDVAEAADNRAIPQDRNGRDAYSICSITNSAYEDKRYKMVWLKELYNSFVSRFYSVNIHNYCTGLFTEDEKKVQQKIRDCGTFYLLKSIPLNELIEEERTLIEIPKDYLQSLTTKEVMTDDFRSHDVIGAKCHFVYNGRLNIGNVFRKLFHGYSIDSTVPMCNDNDPANYHLSPLIVCYSVKKNDGDVYLTPPLKGNSLIYDDGIFYMYYPNPNAFMAHITLDDGSGAGLGYSINMKPHDFLSGAYAYFKLEDAHPTGGNMPTSGSDVEYEQNIIMTSEINNPFVFPVSGINEVGFREIRGISAAVKALSQGQFGQFPMYVFTDDGIWAMEVSPTGFFSAKQPVTRDVCVNTASITQVDNAILFATERGIMMLSGSETVCISEPINRKNDFNADILPYAYLIPQYSEIPLEDLRHLPFKDFLKDCRLIYDYVNQRVIVYNTDLQFGNKSYVWSLKSKEWGSMQTNFKSHLNSYSNALAMDRDGNLLDVSHSVDPILDDSVSCVIITRPLKLNTPDIFKTVDSVIQRGIYSRQSYPYFVFFLWGSRDLKKWELIYASRHYYLRGISGSPYKYFRIGFISWSHHFECLSGASFSFHGKLERDI